MVECPPLLDSQHPLFFLPPPFHAPPQSAELYRQLGALLARANAALMQQRWDWAGSGVLRRQFDWNLECLPATYARVRPQLLQLPGVDV